jgi:ssDNA-binding Zn-finger/Zn-ribbon topoisomerase 1
MGEMADRDLDLMFDYDNDDGDYFGSPRKIFYGRGDCPQCGGPTVLRVGKFGKFYGCTSFPECKGSRQYIPIDQELTVSIRVVKTAKILVSEDGVHCGMRCPERGMAKIMGGGQVCYFFEENIERDDTDIRSAFIRCSKCLKKAKDIKKEA